MVENKNTRIEEEVSFVDFIQFWELFKKNWKWFPLSIIVCMMIAGIYLWFTPTTLSVSGKMEIIDKSNNNASSMSTGMALLNSLPLNLGSSLGGVSFAIGSEKEVLLSNILVGNVVKDLGIYTEYRLSKWGRNTLLYKNNPITVSLDSAHVKKLDTDLPLTSHQILLTIKKSDKRYKVKTKLVEGKDKKALPTQTFETLPATIETELGTLTISENILPPKQARAFENGYTLKITISPPSKVADSFLTRLSAAPPASSVANMLKITLRDENVIRSIDVINQMVNAYNQRANNEKNEEARKTDEFVNARLQKIDLELGSTDDDWENSKKQYQITSPEVDAQEALSKKSEYEAKLVAIGTELQLHDYLSDYIDNPANYYELIPIGLNATTGKTDFSSGSVSDGGAANSSLIARHNSMVSQRKDLLKSLSEMSPQVQRLTESIRELHPDIQLAMKRQRESIVMQKNALEREYAKYSGRIGTAPQMERVLTEIGRQREIKQAVYLVLLQKREETAMQLANTADKGRLIDEVKADQSSVKPRKKIILSVFLLLGALIPMGALFLLRLLKSKIDTSEELEALTNLPLLAEISDSDCDEAIRTLRTRLMLNIKPEQKVLLVASQNSGDGKTFIAKHLEECLTVIGKKVLYINGDLRKGEMGGHPVDVLASEGFVCQIDQAKATNDYVIIDSPAIAQYVDALLLAQYADATLYIVKSGSTVNSDVESLNFKTHLPQPMLIFNNYIIKN
jgi:uncharacterized protein involved in exopolysaccharide biosynthesis